MNEMVGWDTFGLFEGCLSTFDNAMMRANRRAATSNLSVHQAIAVEGFGTYHPVTAWTEAHSLFMQKRVAEELSPEALEWFEEGAEAVALFSCLVLGAMLGKEASSVIDPAGFMLGDAHLFGFIMLNNEKICALCH